MNHDEQSSQDDSKYHDKKVLWDLLREHGLWLNQEKSLIWNRFAASLTAVSIIVAATAVILTTTNSNVAALLPEAMLVLGIAGAIFCILWLIQTCYGWSLQNKRLNMIQNIQMQLSINDEHNLVLYKCIPCKPTTWDWHKIITVLFIIEFLILFVLVTYFYCMLI